MHGQGQFKGPAAPAADGRGGQAWGVPSSKSKNIINKKEVYLFSPTPYSFKLSSYKISDSLAGTPTFLKPAMHTDWHNMYTLI